MKAGELREKTPDLDISRFVSRKRNPYVTYSTENHSFCISIYFCKFTFFRKLRLLNNLIHTRSRSIGAQASLEGDQGEACLRSKDGGGKEYVAVGRSRRRRPRWRPGSSRRGDSRSRPIGSIGRSRRRRACPDCPVASPSCLRPARIRRSSRWLVAAARPTPCAAPPLPAGAQRPAA